MNAIRLPFAALLTGMEQVTRRPFGTARILNDPQLLAPLPGLRIAATIAPIGAVVADMNAGTSAGDGGGLGFQAVIFASQAKYAALFATAAATCVLGFALNAAVLGLAREEIDARFDAIARSMPEFHYGRFDVRFASVDTFARGEDFAIVEVNGIGGEAIDVWDPQLPVGEAYRRLLAQQRLLFLIGEQNRARGFAPTPDSRGVAGLDVVRADASR